MILTAKARSRVQLEGAKVLVRNVPASAALAALRSGQDLRTCVLVFDAVAGSLISALDIMCECAGVPTERREDLFNIPDWSAVAEKTGESPLTADHLRELFAHSRARLGFSSQAVTSAATQES